MHNEDDIVVCPECATPQHRSCWLENGKCINEKLHGTGYVWAPGEKADNIPFTEKAEITETVTENETDICHICGSENPKGSTHCGACGALLNQSASAEASGEYHEAAQNKHCNYCGTDNDADANCCKNCGAPLNMPKFDAQKFTAAFNMDENEEIGGIKVGELAVFVKRNVTKYLDAFKKSENGGVKFNWAAFFLGPIWFFYRKLYGFGLIVAALIASAQLVFASVTGELSVLYAPYIDKISNGTISQAELAALSPQVFALVKTPLLITAGLVILINLVFALSANKIYFKKIKGDIQAISENFPDEKMRMMLISRRGGVSALSGACGYFSYSFICSLLVDVADMIKDKFI